MIDGVRGLNKKSEGPGIMGSGTQDELRGFGFRCSARELERVNAWRLVKYDGKKPPLVMSPGLRFLKYGKNNAGYWNAEQLAEQCQAPAEPFFSQPPQMAHLSQDLLDAFECLHRDWQLLFEVDWSMNHARHRLDALNAAKMNKLFGGAQPIPHPSKLNAECIGSGSAKMARRRERPVAAAVVAQTTLDAAAAEAGQRRRRAC